MTILKGKLKSSFTTSPRFHPIWDGLVTIGAFLGWYSGFEFRSSVIAPACAQTPASCSPETVNALDRWGMVRDYLPWADHLSYWTQDLAGVLAISTAWYFSKSRKEGAIKTLLLLQCTFINGALIEFTRLAVQRPRPFVYFDPLGQGHAVAHYTSFYSGHTSFAALASTCAVLFCLDSKKSTRITIGAIAVSLTVLTGALRVLASRHFISDVIFGAFIATGIALAVNLLHRQEPYANASTL